jgi:hypothetical protein
MKLFLLLICIFYPATAIPAQTTSSVNVQIVTDEADAVLAILKKQNSKRSVTDQDWQSLFNSEGYLRLKKRELSLKRPFDDATFKAFVLWAELSGRADLLATTLVRWRQADIQAAARRALVYLPPGAGITAKIYPVIKPQTNSFVFEPQTDPAIFLYLDPAVTKDQFENTLAHELHHIGYARSCGKREALPAAQSAQVKAVIGWLSAFGEGFAMLAAAGGPDVHPHQFSKSEDRARWDRDVANFNVDLKKVESFFNDILNNRLTEEQRQHAGYSFFGVQGPWYTVGWKMSGLIEKTYGRAKLIECMCDHRKLLITYNQAATDYNRTAREPLAIWSPELIKALESPQ